MSTIQSQIKITLPQQLKDLIQSKAQKFGLPIAGYVKHLILKDIENMDYPVFQASGATEKAYQKARQAEAVDKLAEPDDISEFLKSL